MRIAIAGVVTKQITEHPLGGTEAFTSLLIEGLVNKGHEVTLYCAKGSRTKAQRQIEICNAEDAMGAESNLEFVYPYTLIEADRIIKDIPKYNFDLIHVSLLKTFFFTYFADQIKIPIVHTMHRDFFEREKIVKLYNEIGFKDNEHFVFVSQSALSHSLIKNNTFNVFNGINIAKYPFSEKSGDKLLWLSRIDPLKGPKEAITAANQAQKQLVMSGDIDRQKYQDYFDNELKSLIVDNIVYEKPVSLERNLELFHNAKAFLFPIQWEEPCPLTVLESMACGTPLVTYARGSLVESMVDGETGFLVNPSDQDIRGNFIVKKTGIEGLVEGINRIYSLTDEQYRKMRTSCRQRIEQNFTNDIMINKYIDVYKEILKK
jgi:glycosyltransferase involved in cell wall biosynthesis